MHYRLGHDAYSQPLRLDIDPLVLGSPWLIAQDIVKAHSRIDSSEDDALLEIYLRAAIGWAENATERVIYQRSCRWVLRNFPIWSQEIRLPCGLAQSVEGIEYVSGAQTHTLTGPSAGSPAGADYQEDLRSDSGGVLMPPLTGTWPAADYNAVAPVVINFTAGWAAANVPAELQHAILFAVEDMWDGRASADTDPSMLNAVGSSLAVRETLISPYRLTRIY